MLYTLQELADREELRRQQEEYRVQQEELERRRLEEERIAQEDRDRKRKVCALWTQAADIVYFTLNGQTL